MRRGGTIWGRRRSKFGAVRTHVDGHVFASKREAQRYRELRLLERAGEITGLDTQYPFAIVVNGLPICKYLADFRYYLPDGTEIVEDAKGVQTREYQLKKKLVRACYGIDVQEV